MARSLFLGLTLFFLAACEPQPFEEEKPRIVMQPTGTVEAASLVSAFNQTCLPHFPDNEAIVVAFKRTGYSIVEEPSDDIDKDFWRFSNRNRNISAASGNSIILWHGANSAGESDPFQFCQIEAELSNPEQAETALEQLVTPSGKKVELLVNEVVSSTRDGTVQNSSGTFRVSFEQSLIVHGLNQGKLPEKCGGLEKCLVWGRAKLSIGPVRQQ